MFRKVSHKIIAAYSTLIVLLVASLMIFFNSQTRNTHLGIIKREMDEKLHFIELYLQKEHPGGVTTGRALDKTVDTIAGIINLRVTLVDFNGLVISDSGIRDISTMDNHLYRVELKKALDTGSGDSIRHSHTLKTDLLYSAKRSKYYLIRLAKPLVEIEKSTSIITRRVALSGLAIIFASFFIIIIISKRITKPINETLMFSRQFSEGDYSRRIHNYSDDEIGDVQRSLNRLADALVEKIDSLIFEQNKLKITLESIDVGIAVVGQSRRLLVSNEAFKKYLDIESGITHRIFFEVIRNRSLNNRIEKAISTGAGARFEEKTLSSRHLDVSITPIREEKTIQGILIALQDITEKKKIERMKTDLVGNMSHELKTPLAIIKGYLETIQENLDNRELADELISRAIDNAKRQNALINDILKLNMIETSQAFAEEKVKLDEVLDNCINILKPKINDKEIDVVCSYDVLGENEAIRGNSFLVEEVFFNIIDNAINYNTSPGKIEVSASMEGDRYTISISDTGIGIPDDSIDRIFERFYRVDKSRSRDTGGTGLGLSIVKHAVELLNWEISVSSSSRGTTFTITV